MEQKLKKIGTAHINGTWGCGIEENEKQCAFDKRQPIISVKV